MDELQVAINQRDHLARYIFETDSGTLDTDYCLEEMKAGRCPYKSLPYGSEKEPHVCIPCIVNLLGGNGAVRETDAMEHIYFSLLAAHKLQVAFHVIGGPLTSGRVQSIEGDTVTIMMKSKKIRCYRLSELDVIVPKEILRWCQGELNRTHW